MLSRTARPHTSPGSGPAPHRGGTARVLMRWLGVLAFGAFVVALRPAPLRTSRRTPRTQPRPSPTRPRLSSSSARSGRSWSSAARRVMDQTRKGRPPPRLPRRGPGRRRERARPSCRGTRGEPADRRDQLRRAPPDAAEVEAPRRGDRHPDPLGRDRRPLAGPGGRPTEPMPDSKPAASAEAGASTSRSAPGTGAFSRSAGSPSPSQRRRVAANADRPLPPGGAGGAWADARAGGRPPDLDPAGHLRPDRPAPDAAGGRGVPGRPTAVRLREGWSIGCSPRPTTASAGRGTGSTWSASPRPPATSSTTTSPTPTATATT